MIAVLEEISPELVAARWETDPGQVAAHLLDETVRAQEARAA